MKKKMWGGKAENCLWTNVPNVIVFCCKKRTVLGLVLISIILLYIANGFKIKKGRWMSVIKTNEKIINLGFLKFVFLKSNNNGRP